jgi:hypothetical protein
MGRRHGIEFDPEAWLVKAERLRVPEPLYVGTGEVGVIFNVSSKTVTRWCEAGQIPGAVRVGGPRSRWSIPASWVYGILAASEAERTA